MFKKKIVASVLAAAAAITALSAAVKAEVVYDTYAYNNNNVTVSSGVVYDNYTTVTTYNNNNNNNKNSKNSGVVYDTYTYNPNAYTITFDANGNKVYTYEDGRVYIENTADTTYVFDKAYFDHTDYYDSYNTKSAAEKAVGFTIKTPDKLTADYPFVEYTVISDTILEVSYTDVDDNFITIRKAVGKADISGDDTAYDMTKQEKLNKAVVILYGVKIDGYYKAIAYKNGYCYSFVFSTPQTRAEIEAYVKAVTN
ncbi:MAG: hypothetical protein IJ251_00490 [Oscillospiraceae bacterium]|nr:hypothetical protein [Oscillospiraceae bacterium]